MTGAALRLVQILAFAVASYAQAPMAKNTSLMEQANQAYFAKDWGAAAQAFAAITQAEPANALAWLRLGVSRHKLAQYDQALVAFKRIESDPQLGASALFRESATLLQLKRREDALAALNQAVDAGFLQTSVILLEADLASLHDDPAFKKTIARAEAIAHPCASA